MTTRITYSTSAIRQILENCHRFSYPGASNFMQTLLARSSHLKYPPNTVVAGRWPYAVNICAYSPFHHWFHWMSGNWLSAKPPIEWAVHQYSNGPPTRIVAQYFNWQWTYKRCLIFCFSRRVVDGVVTYVLNEWCSTTKVLFSLTTLTTLRP